METASQLATQVVELAQNQKDEISLVTAHRALGSTLLLIGELAQARHYLEQGLTYYDPEQHEGYTRIYGEDPGLICGAYNACCEDRLGYRDKAVRTIDKTLALAQKLGHPFSLSVCLSISGQLHLERRELLATQEQTERVKPLCSEQGFSQWLAQAIFVEGWATFWAGRKQDGLIQMQRGLSAWRATGAVLMVPYWVGKLAQAHVDVREYDTATSLIAEALHEIAKTGSRYFEVEARRIEGELLWLSDRCGEEAADSFQEAIKVARAHGFRVGELRAGTSLARLLAEQGERTEARDLLVPVYDWFTEGHDTADLKEAKALLDELR